MTEGAQASETPCPNCGRPVDKLRAGALGIFGDTVHYFCTRDCKAAFGAASLPPPSPAPAPAPRPNGHPEPVGALQVLAAPVGASPAATRAEEPAPPSEPAPALARPSVPDRAPDPPPAQASAALAPPAAPPTSEPSAAPAVVPLSLARSPAAHLRPWPALALGTIACVTPLVLPAGLAAVCQLGCVAGLLVLLGLVGRSAHAVADRLAVLAAGIATFATAAGGVPALTAHAPGAAHLPFAFGAAVAAIALVARSIEAGLAARSTAEIRQLLEALPRSALVARTEGETETDLERVRAGEEIVVPAGGVVPVDGAVRAGSATVAPLQARSTTVEVGSGQLVIAGARVMQGELRLVATFVGAERTLARVARLALGQDARPATLVRTATRASVVSSALGLVGAIVIASLSLGGGQPPAVGLATASAFLLALWGRPLARAGATPLATGAGRAARVGAFFRDAAALEAAARVGTVVLPGGGTLTTGTPRVTDVESVGERSADELLALAAAASLAAAPDDAITGGLRAEATSRALTLPEVRRPAHRPGRGVLGAAPGGEDLVVGTRALLLAEGVSVAAADDAVSRLEERGRTTVLIAVGGKVQGLVGLHDAARPGARAAIDALHALGIEPVLLTGDARTTAEALAQELGIEHLRAEVEPDERAAEVRRLTESGTTVAVIGHPAMDGAALDAADVALALRAAGAPQGEPAVRLVGDAVGDAVAALEEARRAITGVRRNVTIASGALVLGGILAGGGLLPPPAAALLLAITSALVVRAPREPR